MRRSGFTLLELSIVIVIIGLIVAGISAGQSLARQAGVRGVIADFDTLTTALNTFKLQYDALPGDMSNASNYWGTDCDVTPANCDGNGNREIGQDSLNTESIRAYQHMALAGILDGNFTGQGTSCIPDETCYASGLSEGNYWIRNDECTSCGNIPFGNTISFRRNQTGTMLTPAEASALDKKLDDGFPDSGNFWTPGAAPCITGSYPNAIYNFSSSDIVCNIQKHFVVQ